MNNFIDVLKWRGMIHDSMPGAELHLKEKMRSAYIGFDPTADSLHIGNLVPIMLLAHFQRCGHKPIALVGGATGMIGDPSGKSVERNLLDESTLRHNQKAIKNQLSYFLDFENNKPNSALIVNNYDWMKNFNFLDFIRDIGKHISVNYMIAKDSVKSRISSDNSEGMSFTEFTYQLVQGYDFFHLYESYNCTIQMGGSDQWGNITTGAELIRRKSRGKGFAITCPLITKSDGSKFGKSEGGNIWLDAKRTSPYKFYQYWLNSSDEDAEKYIKTCWKIKPHPDLAKSFANLYPDETSKERLKRFAPLLNNSHPAKIIKTLKAELLIANEEFPSAKRTIETLINDQPNSSDFMLMAAVEKGMGSSNEIIQGWIAKAYNMPSPPVWFCEKCYFVEYWSPICKKCKSFDSMHWGSPEINNIFYNSKVLLPFVLDKKTFNFEGNKNEEIKHEIYKGTDESEKSI